MNYDTKMKIFFLNIRLAVASRLFLPLVVIGMCLIVIETLGTNVAHGQEPFKYGVGQWMMDQTQFNIQTGNIQDLQNAITILEKRIKQIEEKIGMTSWEERNPNTLRNEYKRLKNLAHPTEEDLERIKQIETFSKP